jgi:hypothetical protein
LHSERGSGRTYDIEGKKSKDLDKAMELSKDDGSREIKDVTWFASEETNKLNCLGEKEPHSMRYKGCFGDGWIPGAGSLI